MAVLLLAAGAFADDQADAAANPIIRDYYATLRNESVSIESVRDRLVPLMKRFGPETGKSVRFVIQQGFEKKYKKDVHYKRCLCEILAAGGEPGMAMLFKEYKSSTKDDPLRVAMAESLGACGDEEALDPLLKIAFDKAPEVAAAAVRGCGKYPKVKQDKRKAAVKKLVDLYGKVTDDAAGKAPETPQMRMYEALRPAMNETLKAFTGEGLDSAAAFKAWFQENGTKAWPE
ncbi:MAG: HEAT repeat domain-containing protein [Planctomycetes bacterium]|nr:HEAT repeat domain-containing protein [Planctomycetota bacterium]